jgi:hypothetical protein
MRLCGNFLNLVAVTATARKRHPIQLGKTVC